MVGELGEKPGTDNTLSDVGITGIRSNMTS